MWVSNRICVYLKFIFESFHIFLHWKVVVVNFVIYFQFRGFVLF